MPPELSVIRIMKVKHRKAKVHIEWARRTDQGWDEFSMTCNEAPRGEFVRALQALDTHVAEICEFPESYDAGIVPIGVSFSWANDVMGATITATKALKYSQSPLLVNTPHKPSAPYSGDDYDSCLTDETVEALETLMSEAEAYLGGERAQGELPLETVEISAEEAEGSQAFLRDMS